MGAVKVSAGDRVRVVWEGIASEPNGNENVLVVGDQGRFSAFIPVSAVEIVAKKTSELKAGDVIRPKDHPTLPEHTVLLHSDGAGAATPRPTIVKLNGKWYYACDDDGFRDQDVNWDDFTIVYLPEQ